MNEYDHVQLAETYDYMWESTDIQQNVIILEASVAGEKSTVMEQLLSLHEFTKLFDGDKTMLKFFKVCYIPELLERWGPYLVKPMEP